MKREKIEIKSKTKVDPGEIELKNNPNDVKEIKKTEKEKLAE